MVLSSTARSGPENLSFTQQLCELQMKLHASEKQCLDLQQKLVDAEKKVKQTNAGMSSLTALAGRKMMLFERTMMILRAAACYHGYPSIDLYIQAMSKRSSFKCSADVETFDDANTFCRQVSPFARQISPLTGEPEQLSPDEAWLDECLLRLGDNWAVSMAGADPEAPAEPLVKEAGVQVHPSGISIDQETQTDTSRDSVNDNLVRQASTASNRTPRGSMVGGGLFSLMGSLSGRSKVGSLAGLVEGEMEGYNQDNSSTISPASDKRQSMFFALKAVSPRSNAAVSDSGGSEMPSPILEKVSNRFLGQRHSTGNMDVDGASTPRSQASAQSKMLPGNLSSVHDTSADHPLDKKPQPPAVPQASPSPRRNSMAAMIRANLALPGSSGGGERTPSKDAPLAEIIRQQRMRRASLQGPPGDNS